jgi:hypothetical protein
MNLHLQPGGATLRLPWLLFWIASISMLGCQTSRSWEQ